MTAAARKKITAPTDAAPLVLTVGADCRLGGGSKEFLAAVKARLTLANPKFQAAKKYGRWVGKKLPEKLFFFREEGKELLVPRGFAKQVVRLALAEFGVQPEIVDCRRQLPEIELSFRGELRPYQEEAVQAILRRDFGVLEAGTGSGKTVIALAAIAARRQPALILVHTKELLHQWSERIETFLGIKAGLLGDGKFELAPVSVAIVNTARNRIEELAPHFGHILVDECHRVPSTMFTSVVNGFDAKYSLGLSATAYRREDVLTQLIYFFMGERVFALENKALQESGAILKPKVVSHRTGFVYNYRDDYATMMTALSMDEHRNRQIVDDVAAAVAKERGTILVVSDRIYHCEALVELLLEKGVRVAILTGRLGAEKRAEIVEEIKGEQIQVLVATLQLIGEGFDAPGLSCLFLATPIKFSGRLRQVIGRILRPAADKQAMVHDYVDDQVGVLKASARIRQETYLSLG